MVQQQFAILRFAKYKGPAIDPIEAHNERTKEQYASNPDIDTTRSGQNVHLIAPSGPYRETARRMASEAKCRLRKDSVLMVEALVTGSPEIFKAMRPEEREAYFRRALAFLKARQRADTFLSAVVHMDEKTPHMHVVFVPLTQDGRLSAKEIIGNRAKLVAWQDGFYSHMCKAYPQLERGESASKTWRDHIPPAVFKQMARLTRQKAKLEALLCGVNLLNDKGRLEQIGKVLERYIPSVEKMLNILPFMGDMRMDEVSVATIQQFYDWMATAGERGRKKNLNAKSIERIAGLAGRIFKVAVEMKIIEESPFKHSLLRIHAEQAGHHKAIADAQIAHVRCAIPGLKNPDERLYMGLLAYTGMRPEEVLGLRWEDVALDAQYATVVRAVTYPGNSKPHVGKPKTSYSARTVVLPGILVDLLRPLQKTSGFILGGEQPWCYSRKHRVSKAAFAHLGLKGYSDADFRTTFGTQMKEMGKTSAEVADMMGHADTRMVERVYARTRHEGVMKHLSAVEEISGKKAAV